MSALSSRVDLATARIHSDDADRQTETAQEILRRLESQPGVVLADDVGMGKTFVALAVAVSLLESQGRDRPVVVMVPSSVKDKWPRDWAVFESLCLNGAGAAIRTTEETVERPGQFLKLFDDPPERRRHLIFATHRALSNMHADPWIDLALVRQALLWQRDLDLQWNALPRWAGRLFPNAPAFKDEDLVWSLLEKPPSQWRATCRSAGRELDDDPVPRALVEACKHVDFAALREVLGRMPLKSSASIDARLRSLSRELKDAIRGLWPAILENASVSSPLLVLDEAHHLRNPNKLAQLFEAFGDGETPVLGDTFDRMLFLTATPFQLGHRELVAVIHRFSAVRWQDPSQRDAFDQQVDGLAAVLDGFRSRTLELDRAWGRLDPAEVEAVEAADPHWWDGGDRTRLPDRMQSAARCVAQARSMRAVVEAHLRPWVVRHTKANEPGHIALLPGRSILPNTGDHRGGLAVEGEAVLPFLLAARAQAEVAADRESKARALFADGLASSFEAYLYTRADAAEACDEDAGTPVPADVPTDIDWYLNRIDQALRPDGDGTVAARHPKLDATVERVVDLWRSGEKTVVFCFFVATGRALRDRIAAGLGSEILRRGAIALGLAPERTREVQATLERIGDRFHRRDSPLRERSESVLRRLVRDAAAGNLTEDDVERVMRIALRFIRTPSFLVRYFDLGADVDAGAIDAALERKDASGLTLSTKIAAFAAFAAGRVDAEREVLFAALEQVQTGTLWVDAAAVDDTETIGSARLPNVRLANGRVKDETRRRLMLAFNTPFFPEVLVASAVMAEGIDLHLDCRHVIHHDLDWNPSVVDQRTGRVDRIGSKAERTAKPIVVYEPFVEGTQDEKQFKVLTDRGHWFGVLMGERLELDESTTDELAARVPLPADLADELTVRLHVYDGTGATEPASPPPPERDPDEVEDLLALLDEHADELPTAVAEAAAKLMGTLPTEEPSPPREDASAAAVAGPLLGELSERERRIFVEVELHSGTQRTLAEIADDQGLTQERIREIQAHAVRTIRNCLGSPQHAAVVAVAERLSGDIGAAAPIEAVTALLPGLGDEPGTAGHIAAALTLWCAGPYELDDGWLVVSPPAELLRQSEAAVAEATSGRVTPVTEVADALAGLGIRREHAGGWVERLARFHRFGDAVAAWPDDGAGRAVLVLRLHGSPMTTDEIVAATGGDDRRTFVDALGRDPRFRRRGPDSWGLSEWGGEGYTNAVDAMAHLITAAGGEMRVDDLAVVMAERYGVAEASTHMNVASPMFERDGPLVRISDDPASNVFGTDPATTRRMYRHDGCWILRVPVDADVLRGSATAIPPAAARELGLDPTGAVVLDTDWGPLTATWPAHDPHIASLRDVAFDLGLGVGDHLLVALHSPVTVRLVRAATLETLPPPDALALLVGCDVDTAEPGIGAVAAALGLDPDATVSDVRERLRERGEDDLAAMLPRAPVEAPSPPSGDDVGSLSGLDPGERAALMAVAAEASVEDLHALARDAAAHADALQAARRIDEFIDAPLGAEVAAVLQALIADAATTADPDRRRLIRGAAVYFVAADDDFTTSLGLEDDARILNAVCHAVGRADLAIELPT